MDAHLTGAVAPGLAAPMPAENTCLTDAAPLAADAVAPAELNAQKESASVAQATQSREQNEHGNSATGAGADKAFLTLRALLALKGYSLSRTDGQDGPVCFHVNRWGMVRELREFAAVHAFAQRVGASHA